MSEGSDASFENNTAPPKTPDRPHKEIREGDITSVTINEERRGIPLPDWDAVESVINMYGSGRITAGVKGELATLSDMGDHGLDAFDMYREFRDIQGPTGTFIDSFMDEAKSRVEEGGRWQRDFDYGGVGPFQKTNLTIEKAPEGSGAGYVLGIYSGRVGYESEQEIAEVLGIERPITHTEVKVEFAPVGDQFRIDMDHVTARLSPLLGENGTPSGAAIADHFTDYSLDDHRTDHVEMGEIDGFGVLCNFRDVDWNKLQKDGNAVTGPLLLKDYTAPKKGHRPASMAFLIADRRNVGGRKESQKVFNDESKERMRRVTQQVADAFQPAA